MPRMSPTPFVILSLMLPLAGCSQQQRVTAETEVAKALISDEQLNQIGEQVHQQLEQQGVRFSQDRVVTSYVDGIANDIFKVAKSDRSNIDWHVHVIDDAKQVNAFATPGGHLYVYTGLLAAADTKAEVAGVMGHETGHVTARHIERQMVVTTGLETLASLALGQNPSQLAQITSALVEKGSLLAFTRSEETEADAYGVKYASQAGYDPNGLVSFFQKLKSMEGNQPRALTFLSDHPATADRIQHVQSLIKQQGSRGGNVGSEEHQQMKRRLQGTGAQPGR